MIELNKNIFMTGLGKLDNFAWVAAWTASQLLLADQLGRRLFSCRSPFKKRERCHQPTGASMSLWGSKDVHLIMELDIVVTGFVLFVWFSVLTRTGQYLLLARK